MSKKKQNKMILVGVRICHTHLDSTIAKKGVLKFCKARIFFQVE